MANEYGRQFAEKLALRLTEDGTYWLGGGMASRSDGLHYSKASGVFTYGVFDEGVLTSAIKEFPNEDHFVKWMAEQSDESIAKMVRELGENATMINEAQMTLFMNKESLRERSLKMFDDELFSEELCNSVSEKLKSEDFRAAKIAGPTSDGFAINKTNGEYMYCLFQNGNVDKIRRHFKDQDAFVAWLKQQSDRSMAVLAHSFDQPLPTHVSKINMTFFCQR